MKKVILSILIMLSGTIMYSQNEENQRISIIPEPVSTTIKSGSFMLPQQVVILKPVQKETDFASNFLKEKLSLSTGRKISMTNSNSVNVAIELRLNKTNNSIIGDEGYTLSVTPRKITINANKPAGLFYGVQTLIQLFPPEIESKEPVKNISWKIPALDIIDYPLCKWRGLMLDVSRHFFSVDEVKLFINNMIRYKYNRFHWHLTDDEGWRIEIKSLPKLTEIGAWRVDKTGDFGTFSQPLPDEAKTYGGFYTQEQIKEVVRYAKERFVEVIPEIDMPGHSMAAIASYPELSCTKGADEYTVCCGAPFIDWTTSGPVALKDNTLCPANEKVYQFVEKVISEVSELFPFQYIHTGGDEAPYNYWEKNEQVLDLMKKEGLQNMAQVQSYFGHRIEKMILAKGKKMMGWDEILEGGISPETALMSWRGMNHGIEASKSGHYVVMSPTTYAYLDYMQGDVTTEPPVYASLRLNKTYEFNPVPKEADANYILGGQANLWTEQIYNNRQLEYMTWPRGFAIAESVWSPESKKSWDNFVRKTENHFKRLDYSETKYSPAIYDPIIDVKKDSDSFYVKLTSEITGLDIYTSFDNSAPDRFYPKYTEPILIPKDARRMRIMTYRGKEPVGRLMTVTVENLKNRAK